MNAKPWGRKVVSPFVKPFASRFLKRKHIAKVQVFCAVTHILFIALATTVWHAPSGLLPSDIGGLAVFRGEAPVLNQTGDLRFENTPISRFRPRNQFLRSSRTRFLRDIGKDPAEEPVLTVITVTRNPRDVFRETARFICQQSFQPLRWLIVNDHSDAPGSYEILQNIAALDPRFALENSTRQPGFPNGRMYALEQLMAAPTKYFVFLDDDDFFEFTAFEKCAWMLESNVNASMCGSYVVGFGDRNYTWTHGFHSGYRVVLNNPLTGSEMVRTIVLQTTGCAFDESLKTGMEDWDFYLCVASEGQWGATIPEYLFWYRQNPLLMRQQRWGSLFEDEDKTAAKIRDRYAKLKTHFPQVTIPSTGEFETLNMTFPFKNRLHLQKSILFIIPWMAIGGGDTANLRLVKELSAKGYRITIVCTLLNVHDDSMISRPLFLQYTHDVFTIPAMIRLADAPRFLSYLIESRGVETVLLSNSQLGYGILPWLSAKYRDLVFIDYVHNEEPEWKNGGYAAFSTIHQQSLDATFTSSEGTRQFMIEHGHDPSSVNVGYLGIDLHHLRPLQTEEKAATRRTLGIPPEATVVIYLARMIPHKQPRVAVEAFLKVMKEIKAKEGGSISSKYRLIMIGDGPMMHEVRRISEPHSDLVMIFGRLHHTEALKYLAVSDIFCLPSTSEGVSFALAESMALGLTALTSNVGGFSELLRENGSYGIMVEATGNPKKDKMAFAEQLRKLIHQTSWRHEMGTRASLRVRDFFDAHKRIPQLINEILNVKRERVRSCGGHLELSSLQYTQLSVLKDLGVLSDYPEIHRALQGKPRGDYGTKYRATCGEYNDVISKLIDLLEKPKPCVEGSDLNVEKLQTAAIEQCGRWCIMNLNDRKRQSGWHVKESCRGVDTFDDPKHKCTEWYKNMPT